jgi:glycosyltransferase involved in cell wall biosynthesis
LNRVRNDELPTPVLMLGKGWFPDELGGLDRYYTDLIGHLPEATGVVIGAAGVPPPRVVAVSQHDRRLPTRILAFWRAARRVGANARVVDAHFALYAAAPVLIGGLRDKALIIHFHGPWADENVARGDHSHLRRVARKRLETAVYRRADQVVVLSSAFRQVLVQGYRVSPWIINVVPPGIDLARFTRGSRHESRRRLDIGDEAFVAISVRRLTPRMGLELLIDAWCEARSRLPPASTLLIAGDGPLRPELERRAAAQDAGGSIRILGRVTDARLTELYSAADVAVVPTLEYEGFGLVVLEAAACGTPTIVTDAGGLPEAIAGLDQSLVVARGDGAALRERLVLAQIDRPRPETTRAFAERFGWSVAAAHHRSVARAALARRAGRRALEAARRIRVVYLDHTATLSGGELALLRLLPYLDRVHPHVVLAEDGPLVGSFNQAGISTEVLALSDRARDLHREELAPGALSPVVVGLTSAYVLRLAARLRRLSPDLVHANSLKSGIYGSLAAKLAGIPMIWHVRDRIAEDYLPRPAVALVRRMTRHLATAVVANSRSTMNTLGAPREPVVIYSILPEVLTEAPIKNRVSEGPLTFGLIGRLAPWKGQDFFLRAFERAFPVGQERAVIVGGALFGEGSYASTLPRLAKDLGIAERVELRGQRRDVWHELSRLDVLVHASLTPEPFGQVIIEGMAAGVPVIAADAGGPSEILRHEVTGMLYAPTDERALAAAMRQMQDPDLRGRLTAAARRALGPYSPSVVAAQLQDLYATVTARHHCAR